MKEWAIRVTLVENPNVSHEQPKYRGVNVNLLVTEIFRYAGTVHVEKGRDGGPELVFWIYRAGSKGTEVWANMNAERIRSFGIKAEKFKMGENPRLAV